MINNIQFFLSIIRYCLFSRKIWAKKNVRKPQGQILVDFYPFSPLLAVYAYFTNILAEKYQAQIVCFKYNKKTSKSFLLRLIYRSFNTRGFIAEAPGAWRENDKALNEAKALASELTSRAAVKNLAYQGITIGESVYLTYLRRAKVSTVIIDDPRLLNILAEAIHLVDYWSKYCRHHKVHALIASHDAYIEYFIPMAVVRKSGSRVYLLKDETVEYKAWDGIGSRFAFLPYLRKMFSSLDPGEQEIGCRWAEERLRQRLAGQNSDLFYAKKKISPFSDISTKNIAIKDTGTVKVLIATSSPYDNPLVYGDFLFDDFNEWLTFLGELSSRTEYEWFLKMHSWADEFYQAEIYNLMGKYPKIKILPITTSFNEIAGMGIGYVLTSYGTVGHELPLLGFQVINAGNNPHISYDFNISPQTRREYEDVLVGLSELRAEYDVSSISSFYYMQYNFIRNDALIFGSSRTMSENLSWDDRFSEKFFDWYRCHYDEENYQYSVQIITDFVENDRSYIFRDGPVSLEEIQSCSYVRPDEGRLS